MANCYKLSAQCTPGAEPEIEGTGLTASCCSYHWKKLLGDLNTDKDLNAEFLSDYAKIYLLMETQVDVIKCLRKLASQLADLRDSPEFAREAALKEEKGNSYVRLSKALAKFENYCWFPPSHEIFIGFLPTENFQSYISRGLMPKDPGAGLEHGDFTHRLHWHCISRIITNDFSDGKRQTWNKSPLQLYCSLGSPPATSKNNNVWFKLLDDNGSAFFRSPDKFHAHVRNGDYGLLSANVARRYVKRSGELNRFIDQKTLDVYRKSFRQIAAPTPKNPDKTISAAAEYKNRMTEKSNAAYAERKAQSYRRTDDGLPIVVRPNEDADRLTIAERLANSVDRMNKINGQTQDFSVYDNALGIVTRKGRLSNLAALKDAAVARKEGRLL